jgi:integrase
MERLRARESALRSGLRARNTLLGYEYDWKYFTTWCKSEGLTPLPATSDTVGLYVASMIERGLVATTATRAVSAIGYRHRREGHNNPADNAVRELLDGARRMRADPPIQMKPLSVAQLAEVCGKLTGGQPRAVRDRAILLVGFCSALRRASLTALRLDDVDLSGGRLSIRVRREKTDQIGRGRWIGIPPAKNPNNCAVLALAGWIEARGSAEGALFTRIGSLKHLHPDSVYRVVRRRLAEAGIDPNGYGGHSLRAGFVTAACEANVCDALIQAQTGHKSVAVLRRYFRRAELFRANAAGMIGL